jgi:hypothetical protein
VALGPAKDFLSWQLVSESRLWRLSLRGDWKGCFDPHGYMAGHENMVRFPHLLKGCLLEGLLLFSLSLFLFRSSR